MKLTRKLTYMAMGAALAVGIQFVILDGVKGAHAESGSQRGAIKYLLTVDYPLGGKADYIEWVKSAAPALKAAPGLMSMASYDNYYGASPNRVIEAEFSSNADAATYFADESVRAVMDDWSNHGVNAQVHVLSLRSDYAK